MWISMGKGMWKKNFMVYIIIFCNNFEKKINMKYHSFFFHRIERGVKERKEYNLWDTITI